MIRHSAGRRINEITSDTVDKGFDPNRHDVRIFAILAPVSSGHFSGVLSHRGLSRKIFFARRDLSHNSTSRLQELKALG